jgi:hypothetical protein
VILAQAALPAKLQVTAAALSSEAVQGTCSGSFRSTSAHQGQSPGRAGRCPLLRHSVCLLGELRVRGAVPVLPQCLRYYETGLLQ